MATKQPIQLLLKTATIFLLWMCSAIKESKSQLFIYLMPKCLFYYKCQNHWHRGYVGWQWNMHNSTEVYYNITSTLTPQSGICVKLNSTSSFTVHGKMDWIVNHYHNDQPDTYLLIVKPCIRPLLRWGLIMNTIPLRTQEIKAKPVNTGSLNHKLNY